MPQQDNNIEQIRRIEGLMAYAEANQDWEELEHIKRTIGYPDDYTMPCYISIDYPAKNAKIHVQKEIDIADRIHFNHWRQI